MIRVIKAGALGCALAALAACGERQAEVGASQPEAVAAADATQPAPTAGPVEAPIVLPGGLRTADNGVPIVRAGLWRTVPQDGDGGVAVQFCRTAPSSQNDAWAALSSAPQPGCTRTRAVVDGVLRVKTRCDQGAAGANETEMTFQGSEIEYETTLTMSVIRSGETQAASPIVTRERWVGDCPADMKDGDRQVVTG